MTTQEIHDLSQNIVTNLDTAATLAGAIDPALIPFIVIGKAVDQLIPELATTVASWVSGNPPTSDELEEFRKKLNVLSNPDLP